jgi:hypothetical protein
MKLVIFGCRRIAKYANQPMNERRHFRKDDVYDFLLQLQEFKNDIEKSIVFPDLITEVVSGKAKEGGDMIGEVWAEHNNIPVYPFPANWKKYGRKAGHIRNKLMAAHADFGIGIWDGFSTGTKNMIMELEAHDRQYIIWPVKY